MAKEVIKKDGTKEPFDVNKIKKALEGSTKNVGLEAERAKAVIEEVSNAVIALAESKEEIATSEIRDKILSELDRIEPAVSAGWRKYEQEKKG